MLLKKVKKATLKVSLDTLVKVI